MGIPNANHALSKIAKKCNLVFDKTAQKSYIITQEPQHIKQCFAFLTNSKQT